VFLAAYRKIYCYSDFVMRLDAPGSNNFSKFFLRVIWQVDLPVTHSVNPESKHLDIGAGITPRNPFHSASLFAIDTNESGNEVATFTHVKGDLTKALPFEDNTFTSLSAYDVLEHIPRWERDGSEIRYPFIGLMNEISRILKPGGIFLAVTPAFPSHAAFADPTHVNIISRETIRYFAGQEAWARTIGYGFVGHFQVIAQTWLRGAGPYAQFTLVGEFKQEPIRLKIQIILKLLNRVRKLINRQKPSHILWVLQKP
jgi:SAM-dependent methyltransferase